MKICGRCRIIKNISAFAKNRGTKTGLYSYCIDCTKEYRRENKDKISAQRSKKHIVNREKNLKRYKEWRIKNIELAREICRASYKKHYEKNSAKFVASAKEWRKNNLERARLLRRTSEARRRTRIKGAGGYHSADDIKGLYRKQNERCVICHCNLQGKYHADHIIPISKGGNSNIENIQILCPPCNRRKGAKCPSSAA